MSIDYARFDRYLGRCIELVNDSKTDPVVVAVYNKGTKGPVDTYLAAVAKVTSATIAFEKENKEGLKALIELDSPYRVARSAVASIYPETVKALPETLKSLNTDTDKLNAIKKLLDIIDDYAGDEWADKLLNGDFGTKAAAAIKEVTEAISANQGLSSAETARAAAYGPAYEKYLSFKQVVRDAYGPGAKQYRRIHMRASPSAGDDENDSAPAAKSAEGAPEAAKPGDGTTEAAKPQGG